MILDILYNLIISPIEMLIELIFSIIYHIAQNSGIAIIGVSIVVNVLVLPLYKKSDVLQEQERDKQNEMKPWLDHIKKNFKGDERYMMTQAYYRQQNYKPIYALRSSISLLLQIPFFIAAFHYLSNLELLQNTSFLILDNLGEPDQLIKIGNMSVNLLPILMTSINMISGAIYTRGFPIKEKIQLYGMALIFLVLLYNSPSGLVFYWTLNNVFSLCKNIVMKLVKFPKHKKLNVDPINKKAFFVGTIFLAVFMGTFIPITIINTSPEEFMGFEYTPISLWINTFSISTGLFIVWFSIFYYLAGNKGKNIFTYVIWIFIVTGGINYFLFGNGYGNMSAMLIFDSTPHSEIWPIRINIAICVVIAVVVFLILKKRKEKFFIALGTILIITCTIVSVIDIFNISNVVTKAEEREEESQETTQDKILSISKSGQNVIVFMLDKAINGYFPEIVSELGLEDSYSGFTYYPNTLSYGKATNFSTPSLYGGYEYVPEEIDNRSDESLKDKQNEALKVLPVLFNNNEYDVTVCDPVYAGNYSWIPDVSIYDEYENISAYNTIGAYSYADEEYQTYNAEQQKWNFVMYGYFKMLPVTVQLDLYDDGQYYSTKKVSGITKEFLESYKVLEVLSDITNITEEGNSFLLIQNSTTHERVDLDENYEVDIVNSDSSVSMNEKSYDVNAAALREVAEWLDFLKQEGVYDNTKIIICSDHGAALGDFDYMDLGEIDVEGYNPLLLVKDFNSDELTTDDTFMTLADIATIATNEVIENPVNPFTGNEITMQKDGEYLVIESNNWDTSENNGNTFDLGDGCWWKVTGDNIFDKNNWEKVE